MKKEEFIQRLESFGLPKNEYLIRSGGSMLLRGLREETADFDLCVSEALAQRLDLEKYPKDDKDYEKANKIYEEIKEMIELTKKYIYPYK